eukprot:TRINITY_DN37560_c0_g1_i1.p2 TRINITY_DN37560_c0_g1~~TRINITY_DN37560_c0_g1_i1.p2  ORF type:complete len:123 (-),score=37.67 TRINITY_DN37560_c0_g1_i1:98-466(-)
MIRRPPISTLSSSSAASDVYKRQVSTQSTWEQPTELFDGNLKLYQLIKKLNLKELMHLDKNSQILVYLSSSFLANPFDTLADLSQAYGTPSIISMNKEEANKKNLREFTELTIKISIENAWG